jgi:hypothetical protein
MTREERLLLAAVSRHVHEVNPLYGWPFEVDDLTRADFDADEITVYRRERTDQVWPNRGTHYRFRTVTEGVDLAVALGLLPVEFSTAYIEGYEAARDEYQDDAPDADEASNADVMALFRITANLDTPHEPYLECIRCKDYVASVEGAEGRSMTSLLDAARDHFGLYHEHESGGAQ